MYIVTIRSFPYLFCAFVAGILCLMDAPVARAQLPEPGHAYMEKKAKQAMRIGDPYTAIEYYRKALEQARKNEAGKKVSYGYAFQLAELYREVRDYRAAADHYLLVFDALSGQYPQAEFYHALMMKQYGAWEKACPVLRDLADHYRGPGSQLIRNRAEIEAAGCSLPRVDSSDIRVNHLGDSVNSAYHENGPAFINDSTVIMASIRMDSVIVLPTGKRIKPDWRSRFFVLHKEGGTWQLIKRLGQPFDKKKVEYANAAISPDGQRLYFNQCSPGDEGKMHCHIFYSTRKGHAWSNPRKLPRIINTHEYTATQPAVGKEARTGNEVVYFVSDRPGGRGGLDIWFTVFDNRRNKWSRPRNAGRNVNTTFNEMTPWYNMVNDELYFSSNGWPGYGGLDVFKIQGELSRYAGEPENAGSAINSPADDLYFTMNHGTGDGFLVSNRSGGIALLHPTCCDDLYALHLDRPELITKIGGRITTRVKDDSSAQVPVPDAQVRLYEVRQIREDEQSMNLSEDISGRPERRGDGGGSDSTDIVADIIMLDGQAYSRQMAGLDTSNSEGNFRFHLDHGKSYVIMVAKKGYLTQQSRKFTVSDLAANGGELDEDFILSGIPLKPVVVENIYYEFDKATLNRDSRNVIDTTIFPMLLNNPDLIVEIGSHTDSVGTDDYNIRLSQARAESVVEYLASRGIDRNRLKAKGYGEEQPIAPNTQPDGTDNPEGRQKNRRTEFRVIGEVRGASRIIYRE